MARKFLAARPRANTADPSSSVSNPTLTSTDAAPRADLQHITRQSSNRAKRSKTFATADEHHNNATAHQEDGIGVALGSPSQAWPRTFGGVLVPTTADVGTTAEGGQQPNVVALDEPLQRKQSKWKKFGNLFRAKTEPTPPSSNDPLYEVHVNDQSVHSRDPSGHSSSNIYYPFGPSPWQPRSNSVSQESPRPGRQGSRSKRNNRKGHAKLTKDNPKSDYQSGYQLGRWTEEPAEDLNISSSRDKPLPSTPTLNVDIPEVEMERYSVMFGNLLGGQPSSSSSSSARLARKSKQPATLDPHVEEPVRS